MKFQIIILLILLLPASHAAIYSIGVSPGTLNIGEISPGETRIVKFSIFSVSDEPLLVHLSSESGNFDFFIKGYEALRSEFSEEATSDWIELINNPVEIDPEVRRAGRGWTDVNVLLSVPEKAEPGYHIIYVQPMPTVIGNLDAPAGTPIVAVSKISLIFKVKGEAEREGIILDTIGYGHTKNFHTKTYFQNTGSVTLYARALNRVYNSGGDFLGEFPSSFEYVKPDNIFPFETTLEGNFDEGTYKIESRVDYTTGEAMKTSTVTLQPAITAAAVQAPSSGGFPWTIILIILIIIVIAVWWLRAKK